MAEKYPLKRQDCYGGRKRLRRDPGRLDLRSTTRSLCARATAAQGDRLRPSAWTPNWRVRHSGS